MGLSWWWPWWEEDGLNRSKAEGYARRRHVVRQRRRDKSVGLEMVEKGHATSGPCSVAVNKNGRSAVEVLFWDLSRAGGGGGD